MPCCAAVATCYLTLPPPIGDTPYADLTEATAAIADRTEACIAFASGAGSISSFTATSANNSVAISIAGNPSGGLSPGTQSWISLNIDAPALITYAFSVGTGSVLSADIDVYASNGVSVNTNTGGTSPLEVAVATAGIYAIRAILTSTEFGTDTFNQNVSANANAVACGIRAAYGNVPDYLVCA